MKLQCSQYLRSTIKSTFWCFAIGVIFFSLIACSGKESIVQIDNYNFEAEKELNFLGIYKIKLSEKQIKFHPSHGTIKAPLDYPRGFENFNFNGIYRIQQDGKPYYFRFGWVTNYGNQAIFKPVEWVGDIPKITGDFENHKIFVVQIPFEQFENISICTIGDSQTWWNEASNLRKNINELDKNFLFVGSNTDIYGYPHDGEGGNNAKKVLDRISRVPSADYYTLLIGINDWNKNFDEAYENILGIVDYLLNKYEKSKILYLTPLPTTNMERDNFNLRLSKNLYQVLSTKKRVGIIDIGGIMRQNENWETVYMSKDGLHQNEKGVKFMAKGIVEHIQKH